VPATRRPVRRSLQQFKDAIDEKRKINVKSLPKEDRNELLAYAISKKSYQAIIDTIRDGANPNTTDERGLTALMLFCMVTTFNTPEVLKVLEEGIRYVLRAPGAYINQTTPYGNTALMIAVSRGNLYVVKILMAEFYADPYIRNNLGKTALDVATDTGHTNVKDYISSKKEQTLPKAIVRGTPLLELDFDGISDETLKKLLLTSVEIGNKNAAKRIINKGVTPTYAHVKMAIDNKEKDGMLEVLGLLLEKGAPANDPNPYDSTSLMYIVVSEERGIRESKVGLEMFKMLLNKGASINRQNKLGITVLMQIAKRGRVDLAKELLKRDDINLDLVDKKGKNALYYARLKTDSLYRTYRDLRDARDKIAEMIEEKKRGPEVIVLTDARAEEFFDILLF
jgi:ankyrin repeat protein